MHVQWDGVGFSARNIHTGKEGYPTRVYEMTVNHNRVILSVTAGFPGTTSDKTLARSDGFVESLRSPPFSQLQYQLMNADGTVTTHSGVYLLCDNGYPLDPLFMAPTKCPVTDKDILFSKRIESVRKDVEATFGIVKVSALNLWLLILTTTGSMAHPSLPDVVSQSSTCGQHIHRMLYASQYHTEV
jgi:hypothetical protein